MAISGTVYSPYQTKWGFSEESTFGTVIADTGNFTMFEGPVPSVNMNLNRRNVVNFDGSRVRSDANVYSSQSNVTTEISFSDVLVRRLDLSVLLYAVMQSVSEAGSGTYQKDFDLTNSTTQPDFASNAGYFATLGIYDPIASYHRKFTSCILRELTLTADLTSDGLLKASGTWITGFGQLSSSNFNTGTWAYTAQNYINFSNPTAKTIDAEDMVLYGFSFTINNHAVRVGCDSSGQAETYALATGAEGYDITGEITVKYDSNVEDLVASCIAGTDKVIRLSTGSDGQAGYVDFQFPGALLDDYIHDYGDERGHAVTIPFTCVAASGTNLLNFEVEDGNDFAW